MTTNRKSSAETSPKDRETEVDRALAKNPGFSRFDAADHVDTDEVIAAYRDAAGETGDPALLARAEADIARATRLRPFDPANYLKADLDIASYRESAAADGDPEIIIEAQALLGSNAFFPPIFCLRLCDR